MSDNKYIDRINLNNETYLVKDSYAQKKLTVNFTLSSGTTYTADKSFAEIKEAYDNGYLITGILDSRIFYLSYIFSNNFGILSVNAAHFFSSDGSSNTISEYILLYNTLHSSTGTTYTLYTKTIDYIVSEGTSSGWNYRKWNSGRIELWTTTMGWEMSASDWTATGSLYYYGKTVTLPFTLSNTSYLVNGIVTSSHHAIVSVANTKTTSSFKLSVYRATTTTSLTLSVYVDGTYSS